MKKTALSFALFAAAVSLVFAAGGRMMSFKADLTGAEIPPVATKASGVATFEATGLGPGDVRDLDPAQESHLYDQGGGIGGAGTGGTEGEALHYKIDLANIRNVTAAHLHMGKSGEAEGPVVAPLYPGPEKTGEFNGRIAEGTITAKDLQGPLAGKTVQDLVKAMKAGDVYVNVHTSQHPGGELRGQVKPS